MALDLVKAQAIIDARPFSSVNDLIRVSGIGNITLNKIKEQNLACVAEQVQEEEQNQTEDTTSNDQDTNDADTEQEPEESTAETINTTDDGDGASGGEEKNKKLEIIRLNSKVIKSEDDSKIPSKSDYAIYGFVTFCILLVFLFVLRKYNLKKNEFEG